MRGKVGEITPISPVSTSPHVSAVKLLLKMAYLGTINQNYFLNYLIF